MLLSVLECEEKIAAEFASAEAILNLCKEQKREPSEDETKAYEAHKATIEKLRKQDLPNAQWREQEAERLQASSGRKGKTSLADPIDGDAEGDDDSELVVAKIKVPATCRSVSNLRCYRGEHADREAYLAGRFYIAALSGGRHESSVRWLKDQGIPLIQASGGQSGSAFETGGFLVPGIVERALIDTREKTGVFEPAVRKWPMGSDHVELPRILSGVTTYFVGEKTAITDSEASGDRIGLTARKLAALTRYPSEFSEDAILSVGDMLTFEHGRAMGLKVDQCGFVGDGTSPYGGIVGLTNALAAGSTVTAASTHVSFETLTFADFESVVGKFPDVPGAMPAWYISRAGYFASMARLLDAAGGNSIAALEGGVSQRQFLGYPVVFTQVMNSTLGSDVSKPKAIFADLSLAATMGIRRGITFATSSERYFDSDELAIKSTFRFDINVHERGTASAAGVAILLKSAAS